MKLTHGGRVRHRACAVPKLFRLGAQKLWLQRAEPTSARSGGSVYAPHPRRCRLRAVATERRKRARQEETDRASVFGSIRAPGRGTGASGTTREYRTGLYVARFLFVDGMKKAAPYGITISTRRFCGSRTPSGVGARGCFLHHAGVRPDRAGGRYLVRTATLRLVPKATLFLRSRGMSTKVANGSQGRSTLRPITPRQRTCSDSPRRSAGCQLRKSDG